MLSIATPGCVNAQTTTQPYIDMNTTVKREVTPDELLDRAESAGDIRLLHTARAYKIYQTRLKDNNALDFDDIIFKTVELLQENDTV